MLLSVSNMRANEYTCIFRKKERKEKKRVRISLSFNIHVKMHTCTIVLVQKHLVRVQNYLYVCKLEFHLGMYSEYGYELVQGCNN